MSLSPSPKRHAAAGHDSPGAKFEFQHFLRHFQKRDEAERAPRRPRGVSQWWFWTWNTWGKLKPINDDTLGVFSHFRTPSKIYGESWEKNMKWTNKSFDLGLALCSRAMNPPFQPIDKPVFFLDNPTCLEALVGLLQGVSTSHGLLTWWWLGCLAPNFSLGLLICGTSQPWDSSKTFSETCSRCESESKGCDSVVNLHQIVIRS